MLYTEIPTHRILPRTIIDQYNLGLGVVVGQDSYPKKLVADYEYFTENPHMLSQYIVRKWYEQGLVDRVVEKLNLELENRRQNGTNNGR